MKAALPLDSVALAVEDVPVAESVTMPVGVTPLPLTETVAFRVCPVAMDAGVGVTVIVGVSTGTDVTATVAEPVAGV